MKKILLIIVILIFSNTLVGCREKDEVYTKTEIDLLLKDYESEILQQQEDDVEFQNKITDLEERIEELEEE